MGLSHWPSHQALEALRLVWRQTTVDTSIVWSRLGWGKFRVEGSQGTTSPCLGEQGNQRASREMLPPSAP